MRANMTSQTHPRLSHYAFSCMDSSAWVLVNSKPNELGWRSPYIGSLAVVQHCPIKASRGGSVGVCNRPQPVFYAQK